MKFSRRTLGAVGVVAVLATAACSSGSDSGSDSGPVKISFQVDNAPENLAAAKAVADAFHAANPDITVTVESRPGGGDGQNLVKTRLSTGDMSDVFVYVTGAALASLSPERNLTPVTDEQFVSTLDENFKKAVTVNNKVYGAPLGTASGMGVFYNKKVYSDLGLKVPTTWSEFMSNAQAIKAAGKVGVEQTYGDAWTSQLLLVSDFHNVASAEPSFVADYDANKTSFSKSAAALKGFQRLQEVHEAGVVNKDFASATYVDGIKAVATGQAGMYPMLSQGVSLLMSDHAADLPNVGFFAQPGDSAADNGLTGFLAQGVFIPKSTEGNKLAAAKKFLAFVSSQPGCDAALTKLTASGPPLTSACTLKGDAPGVVKDVEAYYDQKKVTPALEFLSPVSGPTREQITVSVGTGITSAQKGAAQYDADAAKQAKQLGLPGW